MLSKQKMTYCVFSGGWHFRIEDVGGLSSSWEIEFPTWVGDGVADKNRGRSTSELRSDGVFSEAF